LVKKSDLCAIVRFCVSDFFEFFYFPFLGDRAILKEAIDEEF